MYFIVKDDKPVLTNSLTPNAIKIDKTNWEHYGDEPILNGIKWDKKNSTVVRDMEIHKRIAFDKLKDDRDRLIFTPLDGFDVDEKSLQNIKEAVQHFEVAYPEGSVGWIMTDNTIKQKTKQDLQNILDSFLQRKLSIFKVYAIKKEQIDASTSFIDLDEIDINMEI